MPTPLKDMITDLVDFAGFTQAQIAARIGCPESSISRLVRDEAKELFWSTGKRLEVLYDEHRGAIKAAKLAKVHELTRDLEAPVLNAKA